MKNEGKVNTKEKGKNKTRKNEAGRKAFIVVKDLVKQFKNGNEVTSVLNGINLEIYKNDFTVIMGPSGSGKSTLLYCISGMDSITDGEVIYNDERISKYKEKQIAMLRRGDFGFVFQQMHLVSNLTLFENVAVPGYLKGGTTNAEVNKRAKELLETVGLKERMKHLPSQVSGGEQQRAAIARALIHSPNLIFADEPTGALNRKNTEEVLKLFTQINNYGQSILMVTHDVHVASRATRIIYIEDGAVVGEMNLSPYSEEQEKEREAEINEWLMSLSW